MSRRVSLWRRFRKVKRKGLLLLSGLVALLSFGLGAAFWWPTVKPGISLENLRRISSDMTVEEVQDLLGAPCVEEKEIRLDFTAISWKAKDLEVEIVFYQHKVHSGFYHRSCLGEAWENLELPEVQSLTAKLLHWLGYP